MQLNQLSDNPGARKKRVRVGRGIGSGNGKTAQRGVKGQKSRSGVSIHGFEGGQMPIHMRMPKRGFNPLRRKRFAVVNLSRLQAALDAGKLEIDQPITEARLVAAGCVRRINDGVRILGDGEVTAALKLEVTGISGSAREAVEKAGGSVTLVAPKVDRKNIDRKNLEPKEAPSADPDTAG